MINTAHAKEILKIVKKSPNRYSPQSLITKMKREHPRTDSEKYSVALKNFVISGKISISASWKMKVSSDKEKSNS